MTATLTLLRHIPAKWLTLTDQMIVSGSNFLTSILLSVYLGLDNYGIFAGLWLIVLFASSVHQAYITMPLYTLYFKQEHKTDYLKQLAGLQWRISLLAVGCVFGGLQLYAFFADESLWRLRDLWIALVCGQFIWHDFARRLLLIQERAISVLLLDLLVYGLQPVLFLVMHFTGIIELSLVLLAMIGLYALGMLLFHQTVHGFGTKPGKKLLHAHWQFGRFLIFSALLQWFSGNSYLVAGSLMLTSAQFAAIRIAQNLIGISTVFFQFLENTVPPKLARIHHEEGFEPMRKHFFSSMLRNSAPFLFFLLTLIFCRSILLEKLYGKEALSFSWLIIWFCALQLFIYVGTFARFYLRTIERNRPIFTGYILASIASFICSEPLVRHYGIAGVLTGLFLSQILVLSPLLFLRKPRTT